MTQPDQHPRGLFILSFAEFWDRFSFCGTLTLLMLYTTSVFSLSATESYALWGTYLALGYITPVMGGVAPIKF
ncbi:MAG: amino acid/peptide transporter [uncultured bacterium]|nr:MAG: amino acid/peptide transporter [uncultured bacterium]